jgi:hypothetical protein
LRGVDLSSAVCRASGHDRAAGDNGRIGLVACHARNGYGSVPHERRRPRRARLACLT